MGLVSDRCEAETCRIEQGVFYASDEAVLLVEGASGRLEEGERTTVADLAARDPPGWCFVDRQAGCEWSEPDLLVVGGGTSWEGEGWLAAVEQPGSHLLWILHLENSEPFVAVRRVGEEIIAVSEEYPRRCEWRIPLRHPERLMLTGIMRPERGR